MKNVFCSFLLILAFAFAANGQTFSEPKRTGFDVHSGIDLSTEVMILGKTYPVFATASGAKYIICNSSRTGNDYPVWLGSETEYTHNGEKVRKTSKGKYFVFRAGSSGNPYPVYLQKND